MAEWRPRRSQQMRCLTSDLGPKTEIGRHPGQVCSALDSGHSKSNIPRMAEIHDSAVAQSPGRFHVVGRSSANAGSEATGAKWREVDRRWPAGDESGNH